MNEPGSATCRSEIWATSTGSGPRTSGRDGRRFLRRPARDVIGLALHALDVEPDRQEVADVERVHRERRRLQVVVDLELHAGVALLVRLDRLEHGVDLGAG